MSTTEAERPRPTMLVACWTCGEQAEVEKWADPVCRPCRAEVIAQLRDAIPGLRRHLGVLYGDEVEAAARTGKLPGVEWYVGNLWKDSGAGGPLPYEPSPSLVETVAEQIALAVGMDYRGGPDRDPGTGILIGLFAKSPNGRLMADGYRPLVVGDGHTEEPFTDALKAALLPRVAAWLAADLPDAVRAMDTAWAEEQAWSSALGTEPAEDIEMELDARWDAVILASDCGLSKGAAQLLDLAMHADPKYAGKYLESYYDPFGSGTLEEAWYGFAEQLPALSKRYVLRKRGDEEERTE